MQLVSFLPQESLPSLSEFLVAHLPSEIESVPRGVISSALQQSQSVTSLEKAVRGMENMLKGMCLANHDNDTTYGLISGEKSLLLVRLGSIYEIHAQCIAHYTT